MNKFLGITLPKDKILIEVAKEETSKIKIVQARRQDWRGRIVAFGEDINYAQLNDYARFQPMKNRFDMFTWEGKLVISLREDWLYVLENKLGDPYYVHGNRVVLEMLPVRYETVGGLIVGPNVTEKYDRARVVKANYLVQKNLFLLPGMIVLVAKKDWWQFYRVGGKWYFVSHVCNLLAEESD